MSEYEIKISRRERKKLRNTNENGTKHTKKREETVKKPMEESYIIYYYRINEREIKTNKKMSKKTCSAPRAWRRTHTNKSPLVSRDGGGGEAGAGGAVPGTAAWQGKSSCLSAAE
jgi:hypothetical protein